MKKNILLSGIIMILSCIMVSQLDAQMRFGFGGGMGGGRYYNRPYPQHRNNNNNKEKKEEPKFVPTVNIAIGFGYPNLDKYLLPDLTNVQSPFVQSIKGNYQKTGTYFANLDYQFSRFTSIGLMGSYGTTSVPYYAIGAGPTDPPSYNGSLTSWTVMANMINYFMPVDQAKVNGYLRLAAGVSVWDQKMTDATGAKVNNIASEPSEFAYQVSLGADFNLSPRAALFVEAGYGKYILHAGLKFQIK